MIGSFKSFLVEEEKTVFFTFGRMNPPTIGHEKLLDVLAKKAGNNPYFVYLSQSNDNNKNPLDYKTKVKMARKMFPRHARRIMLDNSIKNVFDILVKLYDMGYKNITMVVGSDRINEFDITLKKYNGKKGKHGLYNFKNIYVVSAGDRDPDAEGVSGMSASKMRAAAKNGDFATFGQGLPKNYSNSDAKQLFNAIRKGMGLKEQKQYKNHIQLEPVSEIREAYLRDNIFEVGEEVVITDKGIVGTIKHLGTNYLVVESKGETWRCWLDGISKLDPNFEVKWDEADFSIGIVTEEVNHVNVAKKRIDREKEADKKRHDRMMDRARLRDVKLKNKETNEKRNPEDPDIGHRKGSQPVNYHAGLKKATKIARDRQFKKQAKMADNNPNAYKPAPGDKTAKTKPSKYTKQFKQMFGE